MEVADAPESHDPRTAHDETEPRVFRPFRISQQVSVGAELDAALRACRTRVDPFLWLLQPANDEDAKKSRDRTDKKHRLPRTQAKGQQMPRRQCADAHADYPGRDVAPR